jgi:hypothetical protein
MTTIVANTTTSVVLPAGQVLRVSGQGSAQVSPAAPASIAGSIYPFKAAESAIGPFTSDVTIIMSAGAAGASYNLGLPLGPIVMSTDAPSNNDGRPDGTIYIQVV